MRRNAFTLIEVIFVIIVLGVLAATALVKLGSMSERATQVKLEAFAGTLTRSSGAGFWLTSIKDGREGSIAYADYDAVVDQYITLPSGYSTGPSFENCNSLGNGVFLTYPFSVTYEVHCKDGTKSDSPKFRLYNADDGTYFD